MVGMIEKVHGLHATSLSLNERFSLLASAAPDFIPARPKRRPSVNSYFNQNNFKNRNQIQQLARRLEFEAKRQALRQRLGALRRFGSETSLPGLRRSNSFGNLSQSSVKQRVQWRQSNGNLSRSASFDNLSQAWRGFRRRGGGVRGLRGRFRGVQRQGMRGVQRQGMRGVRGRGARGGVSRGRGAVQGQRGRPGRGARGGNGLRGGGRGRARGRGGMVRNQAQKPVPTREELDDQLDRYMASTRSALDKELDTYMKNAMELE